MTALAERNDTFRTSLGRDPSVPGRVVMTHGVSAQGDGFVRRAVGQTLAFATFTEENDPYGHRDFGRFEIEGTAVYWKSDLYENDEMEYGAEDPLAAETFRVLTILLATEY
ncbi:DUF3768 domain-containing protein [Fulvimarina endophytica]|uniref:DUF3768 domain-containing protein n=1 Tax=Fulvimarina endophytica TaxID=2293836 RepID=A0A371WY78_9HYPH|nr:DUF3768 domain-containing protein [Fulvimarina endophytica]RFC61909.1 DUF3768 domain-containing protein [Fulvimarina endophytica]